MKRAIIAVSVLLASASAARALGPKESGGRNVAILIFPSVQIIDYTGPWEVLGHAYVNNQPAFRVYTVAESTDPITTSTSGTKGAASRRGRRSLRRCAWKHPPHPAPPKLAIAR